MTRPIPAATIPFVRGQEGRPPKVYLDVAGHPTGGWGHEILGTEAADWPVGKDVPEDVALSWLSSDLGIAVTRLYNKIKPDVINDLTNNQWSALIDFAFNVGTPGTTLWKRLNARQFDQVPAEINKYVYARENHVEVKVEGLVRRRAAEVVLWSTSEPGSVNVELPSSITRNVSTPGAPTDPKPRAGIGPAIGTAVGTVTVAATQAQSAVKAISDALSPYADANDHVKAAVSTLALVAAGLAVTTVVLVWLHNRSQSQWQPTTMPGLPPGTLTDNKGTPPNAPQH